MADGTVVFATELDLTGVKSALSSFEKSKTKVPTVTVPAELGEDKFLSTLDKIGYKAGTLLGNGIKLGIAAVGAVSTGAITLITKSLGSTKELEQNLGGSEAVFADYAKTVQKTGQKAYKLLGLSQSDYLSTANQMGSLFKGLGYDAEEAANITMESMQRAADVASIMGIDTAWAMESIAGAAKGNFTMMDNLGVAINDTTLANYALEKGIKKSVSKMSTQEKVALALELFMENTAYATGQYAKENDTLAGSLTTLGAAWENFLAGTGETSVDDLVWALGNSIDVISLKLKELMPRLKEELPEMITKLTPVLSELLQTVLPSLTEMIVALIPPIASALGEAAKALAPALLEGLLAGLVGEQAAAKVMAFLKSIFNPETATGAGVEQIVADAAIQSAELGETDQLMQQWELEREQMMLAMAEDPVPVPITFETFTEDGQRVEGEGFFDKILGWFGGDNESTEQTKSLGRKAVQDMTAGMEEALPEAEAKATEIGNRIHKAAVGSGERARIEGAPGGEVGGEVEGEGGSNPLAQRIIADVVAGLQAGQGDVVQGMNSVVTAAQSAVNVSSFRNVGLQITKGMADGVRSGQGVLINAINSVIDSALAAAKRRARIHSPSRLFRDEIGAMIAAGTATGVENSSFMVRKAVNNMVADSIPDMRRVSRAASLMAPYNAQGVVDGARAAAMGTFNQTNNFNVPYVTPDEVATTMYMHATYGLAAEG